MTKARFRQLLILYISLLLLAGIVVAFVPGEYSQELADTYANEPEPQIMRNIGLLLSLAIPLFVAFVAGFIGLFLFKSWGWILSLFATAASLALLLFLGPTLSSALESVLFEASSLIWGAVLALAYYSPISIHFSFDGKPRALSASDERRDERRVS
jgi:hypothetical protein